MSQEEVAKPALTRTLLWQRRALRRSDHRSGPHTPEAATAHMWPVQMYFILRGKKQDGKKMFVFGLLGHLFVKNKNKIKKVIQPLLGTAKWSKTLHYFNNYPIQLLHCGSNKFTLNICGECAFHIHQICGECEIHSGGDVELLLFIPPIRRVIQRLPHGAEGQQAKEDRVQQVVGHVWTKSHNCPTCSSLVLSWITSKSSQVETNKKDKR